MGASTILICTGDYLWCREALIILHKVCGERLLQLVALKTIEQVRFTNNVEITLIVDGDAFCLWNLIVESV